MDSIMQRSNGRGRKRGPTRGIEGDNAGRGFRWDGTKIL